MYGPPKMLGSWLIDRAQGLTSQGLLEVVVLVLTAEGREFPVCMSKEDAILMAEKLRLAAFDAKALVDGKLGLPFKY